MSPNLAFCVSEVKKHDYYRYLCCLLVPHALQERFFTILAFNNEIAKIKDVISEPMAGYIRLQWWRDALDEIYNGAPKKHNHIIVNSLYNVISEVKIPKILFDNLLDAREADIDFSAPDNLEAITNYAIGTSSGLFYIMLAAAEIDENYTVDAAYYGGIAYCITGLLRAMKYNFYHNRLMLPLDLMESHGITLKDISEGRHDKTRLLARILYDKAMVNLNHVRELLPECPKKTINVLLPLAIIEPFLGRIKKNNYDLFASDLESGRLELQMQILKSKLMGRI